MSEYRGVVLDPSVYRGETSPPDALEDESRYGNDGVPTDITWVRLPSGLWVRNFNGATSKVDCGTDSSLDISGNLTMTAWVKWDGTPQWGVLITKGTSVAWNNNNYTFGLTNADPPLVTFRVAGVLDSVATLTADTWTLVAVVYDGAGILYINGVSDNTGALGPPVPVATALVIGTDDGTDNLSSDLAFPRVYNYALSAAQIYKIYNAERSLFGV